MATLEQLLAGSYGDSNDYLQRNPWAQAGAQIMQVQSQAPQTNAQAFSIPFIQGLLGGGLMGYGKKQATRQAYQDYAKNPMLQGTYAADQMPEGWSADTGRADLLQGLVRAEAEKKAAAETAKQAAAMEKFLMGKGLRATPTGGFEVDPDLLAAKKQILEEEEKIKGKYSKGITVNNSTVPSLGAELKGKVTKVVPLAEKALQLAKELETSDVGYVNFLTGKFVPGADTDLLNTKIKSLMMAMGYADSGANLSEFEDQTRTDVMGGSWTLNPKEAATFLREFGKTRLENARTTWDVAGEIDAGTFPDRITNALGAAGSTAPPGMKAVYSNTNKVKYVPIE